MQQLRDWWNHAPNWQPFALLFVVAAIFVVLTFKPHTQQPQSRAPEAPPASPAALPPR